MKQSVELRAKFNDKDVHIGYLKWDIGPGSEFEIDIPYQRHNNEESIYLVGLQYLDFSEFALLIEINNVDNVEHYYLNTLESDIRNGEVVYLQLVDEDHPYLWFTQHVAKQLINY